MAQRARMQMSWKNLTDDAYVVAGSPDTVVEKLTELAQSLKIGHLMLLQQIGNMPRELTQYNTTMFAEKVMPRLRHLFDEYEDHWYPKPLAAETRAAPNVPEVMKLGDLVAAGGGD